MNSKYFSKAVTKGALSYTFFGLFLLFACVPACRAGTVPLTILYTTDTHGHIASDGETMGLDRIARIKERHPGAVLLDAGDFLHGTPLATFDQGKTVIRLMHRAGYDAVALGNHEFDYGLRVLRQRVAEACAEPSPMEVLSANVRTLDGALLVKPWLRVVREPVTLCVFGLTTEETKTQTAPDAVTDLLFADVSETAASTAAYLRHTGCDVVVALTHVGSDAHVVEPSTAIARNTPGLDAVIDGHSHRRFAELVPNGPITVSSGAHGNAVGKLELFLDAQTKKIVTARNTFLTVKDVGELAPVLSLTCELAAYTAAVDSALGRVAAISPAPLAGDREAMRTRETRLGDLAADALRAAYGTDVAIINSGGIREGLPEGPVTRKDLQAVFPFADCVVSMEVTGKELHDILEHGFSKLPGADGAFPQLSGLTVIVDAQFPPGSRVRKVTAAEKALRQDAVYTLAANGFLTQGGDGYPHLATKKRLQSWMTVEEAMTVHLNRADIFPPKGERILFTTDKDAAP